METSPLAGPGGVAAGDASVEIFMARYAAGDESAFSPLYRALSPRLFGYLLRLTRDRHQAEDLVQVTFSKVHRARSAYFPGSPVLPWLLAIGRRSFLDLKRRQKVRPEDLTGDGSVPDPTPEAVGSSDDLARELELALDRLPSAYAEAIQLTKVTGLSIAEAAEVLGTTSSAVKLRVHRGYHMLRKELLSFGRNF
jgi:RNA polymerase sigma-70 factor (ECF subfamily)